MKKIAEYMKKQKAKDVGITLIALVITIIVLLILAGVTIGMATSNNGIIGKAKQASETWQQAQQNEAVALGDLENQINDYQKDITPNPFDEDQKLNKPVLKRGMTPVTYDETTKSFVKTSSDNTGKAWYDYANKKWANAQTEDGSLWVWIPRYAYRINSADKTVTIQFLKGITDTYVDNSGMTKSDVKRCKSTSDAVDTTTGLTVHPAFTDESSIGYRNGGWDSELSGMWVAKYEAAYTTADNVGSSKAKVSTGLNYIAQQYWYYDGTTSQWRDTVTNYEGQTIGVGQANVPITYPTFQQNSYSYNYICHNDAFNLCEKLTQSGNIYGLSSSDTESHVIKNSEWGAAAYLGQSSYGLGSTDIAINNYNDTAHKGVAHAKTGYNDKSQKWNEGGATASNTGTVYGIYDMSGGLWSENPAYINNGNAYLQKYGQSILGADGTESSQSSKHKTVYPGTSAENTLIYGDAVKETSRMA